MELKISKLTKEFRDITAVSQRPRCKQRGIKLATLQSGGVLVYAPLRSALTMRHWRIAPLAAFANCPCKHGRLAHCSRE